MWGLIIVSILFNLYLFHRVGELKDKVYRLENPYDVGHWPE